MPVFLAICSMPAACAPVRTPVEVVKASPRVHALRIALIDVLDAPSYRAPGEKHGAVSLPDEVLVRTPEGWQLTPSPVALPRREIVASTLRHAGHAVELRRSLHAAHASGDDVALLCAILDARALFRQKASFSWNIEGHVEMTASIVDARSGRRLWRDRVQAMATYERTGRLRDLSGSSALGGALSPLGGRELLAQSGRALVAQALVAASMDLARIIDQHTGGSTRE